MVFFLFLSEYGPKIKGKHPGLSTGYIAKKLGDADNIAADDKQPYGKMAVKLKEKYKKDIAAYQAKGKPDAKRNRSHQGWNKKKSKKKNEDEENEENEEEQEIKINMMMTNQLVLAGFFFFKKKSKCKAVYFCFRSVQCLFWYS